MDNRVKLDLPVETERLLQRGVVALEKLADDPVLQVESGPPECPFCHTLNPEIRLEEAAGEGPFSTFLLEPECGSCGQRFYAVPLEWANFQSYQDAEEELGRRKEVFSVNNE